MNFVSEVSIMCNDAEGAATVAIGAFVSSFGSNSYALGSTP